MPTGDTIQLDDRKVPLGPRCRTCETTEARCAYKGGCCTDCSHWGPRLFLVAASLRGGRPRTTCVDCRRRHRTCLHAVAS